MTPIGPNPRELPSRRGFSLVELLVATTILLVIVIMTSMVFQQTNGAFQSGTRRVKLQASMRTVSGTILHDLAFLVDSSQIPDFPGKDENRFRPNEIKFWVSGGGSGVEQDARDDEMVVRPFRYISYAVSMGVMKRKEDRLIQRDGAYSLDSSGWVSLNDGLDAFKKVEFSPVGGTPTVPLRVDIRMEKLAKNKATSISAYSAGPDRDYKKVEDNIWVGEPPD